MWTEEDEKTRMILIAGVFILVMCGLLVLWVLTHIVMSYVVYVPLGLYEGRTDSYVSLGLVTFWCSKLVDRYGVRFDDWISAE